MKIKTTHSSPTASDVTVFSKESKASEGEVSPRDHQQRHPVGCQKSVTCPDLDIHARH
jgi:hypothetical protein